MSDTDERVLQDVDSPEEDLANPNTLAKPARYPALPAGYHMHDHHYALGWTVTHEWFVNFALRFSPTAEYHNVELGTFGMRKLKRLSRYDSIYLCKVLPDVYPGRDDPTHPEKPFKHIVAIAHTATRSMLYARPSRATYEWLKSAFGREPRWYRDWSRKD